VVNRKWYSHPVLLTGIAINIFALLLAVSVRGSSEQLMRVLTEDGIVEWMQFLCFAMTAGLLVFAGVERWKRSGFDLATLGMLGLGLLVAAAAMEEISWFQRILHVQSSEFFAHNNRQGETNLHNLAIGKSGSIHKTIMLKMILLAGLTHNVILRCWREPAQPCATSSRSSACTCRRCRSPWFTWCWWPCRMC